MASEPSEHAHVFELPGVQLAVSPTDPPLSLALPQAVAKSAKVNSAGPRRRQFVIAGHHPFYGRAPPYTLGFLHSRRDGGRPGKGDGEFGCFCGHRRKTTALLVDADAIRK